MKKWIAFLLALVCLLSLCACNKEENKEEDPYVTVYLPLEKIYDSGISCTYTYDSIGNLTENIFYQNGKEIDRDTYIYDENGNQTEDIHYHSGREGGRNTRTYDMNNHILEEVFYNNGTEYRRDTYTYDENGNLTEYIMFLAATTNVEGCLEHGDMTYRDTYAYDQDGCLIEETHYLNGKEMHKSTYIYDSQNNRRFEYMYSMSETGYGLPEINVEISDNQGCVIRSEYYHSDVKDHLEEAEPFSVYTYTYEGEKQVEFTRYYNGELKHRNVRAYDQQGNPVLDASIDYTDGIENNRYEKSYEYTYDTAGNITQCKAYNNGKQDESSSYTCTYIAVKLTREQAEKLGYI